MIVSHSLKAYKSDIHVYIIITENTLVYLYSIIMLRPVFYAKDVIDSIVYDSYEYNLSIT